MKPLGKDEERAKNVRSLELAKVKLYNDVEA